MNSCVASLRCPCRAEILICTDPTPSRRWYFRIRPQIQARSAESCATCTAIHYIVKGKRLAGIPSPDRADAILTRTCTLFNIARGQTVSNRCCHTTFAVDASSSALLATARSDGAHILLRQALPGTLQHGASIFGWTEPPQGLELLFGDVLA